MKKTLPYLIALSALSVSASAAFYSVYGLSKLFAGASTQVIIMAGALEVSKLIISSLLYQYWETINKFLRIYFVVATFILMVITSGGIYGFLSGAYKETATKSEFLDSRVGIVKAKLDRFEETRDDLSITIKELTTALSNPTKIQYVDKQSGQLVTTTSSRQRKLLQGELKEAKSKHQAATDSISVYDVKILEMQIGNEASSELGPLKYIAELTNRSMDSIINWFMLLIIFVFDPLAIAMVVAANFAFGTNKRDKDIEDLDIDLAGMDRLEKVEALNSEVINRLERIKQIEDRLNSSSSILNNIRNDQNGISFSEFKLKGEE